MLGLGLGGCDDGSGDFAELAENSDDASAASSTGATEPSSAGSSSTTSDAPDLTTGEGSEGSSSDGERRKLDVQPVDWNPQDTVLGQIAADLEPGEWAQLPLANGIGSELPSLEFCETAAWMGVAGKLAIVNAAHSQPTKMQVYDAVTNTWSAHPSARVPETTENRLAHCYDHVAAIDGRDLYYLTYAVWTEPRGPLFKWDGLTEQWSMVEASDAEQEQRGIGYARDARGTMSWFPDRDVLVLLDHDVQFREFSLETGAWRWRANVPGVGKIHAVSEYDPVGKRVIVGGGEAGGKALQVMRSYDESATISEIDPAPFPVSSAVSKMIADPVSGDILLFATNHVAQRMAVLPAGETTWHEAPPIADETIRGYFSSFTGHNTIVASLDTFGVVAIIGFPSGSQPVFLVYKHAD